jgi:hypothetical protein
MTPLFRFAAYFAVCIAAMAGSVLAIYAIAPAGFQALPATSATASPKIEAWLERQAVSMPEPPRPHGPALTADELRALTARAEPRRPAARIPVMAMGGDDEPPPARARPQAPRPRTAPAIQRQETARSAPSASTYTPTARELYSPERHY